MRTATVIFAILVSLCLHPPHALGAERKRLLIINSYNDGAPWAQEIVTPVLNEISNRKGFTATEVVYLNSTLIHNAADYENMKKGFLARYAGRRPDYLVLVGNFSFTLRDVIVEQWGDVPMLLVAQSDQYGPLDFYFTHSDDDSATCSGLRPLSELQGKYDFTLVHAPNLYKETIGMMKQMFPDMRRLVFVADALYLNRHLSHQIKDYLAEEYPGMEYEWLVASDENGKLLQQYLSNNDPATGLLLSTWFFERITIHGYPQLIAGEARMITGGRRPVFGLRSAYFSYGIMGGCFPSPEEQRKDIFEALDDLLADKDMRKVPFRRVDTWFPMVNYPMLVRDSVPVSSCPPGTVFLNRPATPWEQYRFHFIAVGAILLLAAGIVTFKIIYQKKRIEMLRARDCLVGKMPIGYSQATVRRDSGGNVTDVDYHGYNDMFTNLLLCNSLPGKPSKLFDNRMISAFVEKLLRERRIVRFSHHFEKSDTDYEFMASINDDDKGKDGELDIFAVDITDQKRKEAMLIEAREKATESDRQKMAFLANMSHEIRTPLNAIVGFSRLLIKTDNTAKRERFVNLIELNNELLLKIIGDVLDTEKVESNTLEVNIAPVDLNKLLETVEGTVRMRLPRQVALNMVAGAPECVVDTDQERVSQVLINLLTNAIKFTPRGSITFGYEVRDKEVYLFVRDTGKGIAHEDIDKLFERFTKLDNFVQGTGLGLSISKSIVEKLGGEIGAESRGPGRGSLFWFTLPLGRRQD